MDEEIKMSRRAFALKGVKIVPLVFAGAFGVGGTLIVEYTIKELQEPSFPMPLTLNKGEGVEIGGSGIVILLKDVNNDMIFGKFADIRILSNKDNHQLSGDVLRMNETENKPAMYYNGYTITVEDIVRSMTSTTVKITVNKT